MEPVVEELAFPKETASDPVDFLNNPDREAKRGAEESRDAGEDRVQKHQTARTRQKEAFPSSKVLIQSL